MERQLLKNEVFALNSKKILEDNKLDSQSFSSILKLSNFPKSKNSCESENSQSINPEPIKPSISPNKFVLKLNASPKLFKKCFDDPNDVHKNQKKIEFSDCQNSEIIINEKIVNPLNISDYSKICFNKTNQINKIDLKQDIEDVIEANKIIELENIKLKNDIDEAYYKSKNEITSIENCIILMLKNKCKDYEISFDHVYQKIYNFQAKFEFLIINFSETLSSKLVKNTIKTEKIEFLIENIKIKSNKLNLIVNKLKRENDKLQNQIFCLRKENELDPPLNPSNNPFFHTNFLWSKYFMQVFLEIRNGISIMVIFILKKLSKILSSSLLTFIKCIN